MPSRLRKDELCCITVGKMILKIVRLRDMYVLCMRSDHLELQRCSHNKSNKGGSLMGLTERDLNVTERRR